MKKGLLITFGLSMTTLLSSCFLIPFIIGDETVNDDPEEGVYTTRNVNVYRKKNVVSTTFKTRFYEDSPNIPYVGVRSYFNEFFDVYVSPSYRDGVYSYYRGSAYIKVNTSLDTFEINDIATMGSHPDFGGVSAKTFILDGTVETTKYVGHVIDLKKYQIPAYAGKDDAYVPLTLLSNFLGGTSLYNVVYNGGDIYVIDWNGQLSNGESRNITHFGNKYYEYMNKTTREDDNVNFAYNLLCLTIDNARGYTEQTILGDNDLRTKGLDGALQSKYPKIKQLLMSSSSEDYQKGLTALFTVLYDGGHTGILSKNFPDVSYYRNLLASDPDLGGMITSFVSQALVDNENAVTMKSERMSAFSLSSSETKYYRYNDEYKTAYIGFDSFDYDYSGWDAYYKNKGSVPIETDTYAYVRDKLYRAKNSGAKNIILDISQNGGGSIGAYLGIGALFNKSKCPLYTYYTINQVKDNTNYFVDINLDGRYNKQDEEECNNIIFDNVVVLTSKNSFSCGNLFPTAMKEFGYKIVGERSGGGSCAITVEATVDGVFYVRSSNDTLCDSKWNNVDGGVAVSQYLVDVDGNGKNTYAKFYDFHSIVDSL